VLILCVFVCVCVCVYTLYIHTHTHTHTQTHTHTHTTRLGCSSKCHSALQHETSQNKAQCAQAAEHRRIYKVIKVIRMSPPDSSKQAYTGGRARRATKKKYEKLFSERESVCPRARFIRNFPERRKKKKSHFKKMGEKKGH
jgi:hypothetical protein